MCPNSSLKVELWPPSKKYVLQPLIIRFFLLVPFQSTTNTSWACQWSLPIAASCDWGGNNSTLLLNLEQSCRSHVDFTCGMNCRGHLAKQSCPLFFRLTALPLLLKPSYWKLQCLGRKAYETQKKGYGLDKKGMGGFFLLHYETCTSHSNWIWYLFRMSCRSP